MAIASAGTVTDNCGTPTATATLLSLAGQFSHFSSAAPVPDVTVTSGGNTTASDQNGDYLLSNVSPVPQTLIGSKIGDLSDAVDANDAVAALEAASQLTTLDGHILAPSVAILRSCNLTLTLGYTATKSFLTLSKRRQIFSSQKNGKHQDQIRKSCTSVRNSFWGTIWERPRFPVALASGTA